MKSSQIPRLDAKIMEHNLRQVNIWYFISWSIKWSFIAEKAMEIDFRVTFKAWKTISLQNQLKLKKISLKRMLWVNFTLSTRQIFSKAQQDLLGHVKSFKGAELGG